MLWYKPVENLLRGLMFILPKSDNIWQLQYWHFIFIKTPSLETLKQKKFLLPISASEILPDPLSIIFRF